jgi:hypothetical protein
MEAADATLALWGGGGLDFAAVAADVALEARLALDLTREIKDLSAQSTTPPRCALSARCCSRASPRACATGCPT